MSTHCSRCFVHYPDTVKVITSKGETIEAFWYAFPEHEEGAAITGVMPDGEIMYQAVACSVIDPDPIEGIHYFCPACFAEIEGH